MLGYSIAFNCENVVNYKVDAHGQQVWVIGSGHKWHKDNIYQMAYGLFPVATHILFIS